MIGKQAADDTGISNGIQAYSDVKGSFDYSAISGGLLGCPKLKLYFPKQGYQTQEIKLKCSNCPGLETVFLERMK